MARLREWIATLVDRLTAFAEPYVRQVMARIGPYAAEARSRYQKLEPRERRLVRIAGVFLAVFILYDFVYIPIVNWGAGLQDRVVQRRIDLAQVRRLATVYTELKNEMAQADRAIVTRSKEFSLFSVLESSLTTSVGREKIGSITPGADRKVADGFTEYSVQVKLENVGLEKLVDALYGINTLAQPVGIETIRIQRRTQDPHSYDVDMTCVTLAKGG